MRRWWRRNLRSAVSGDLRDVEDEKFGDLDDRGQCDAKVDCIVLVIVSYGVKKEG